MAKSVEFMPVKALKHNMDCYKSARLQLYYSSTVLLVQSYQSLPKAPHDTLMAPCRSNPVKIRSDRVSGGEVQFGPPSTPCLHGKSANFVPITMSWCFKKLDIYEATREYQHLK